jgi:ketosteroid isomerase-like protein
MTSANLDLVRSMHAAWDRGDFSHGEWADPEIEYVHADGPQPGTWRGLAEMADAWRTWLSVWDDFRVEAHEYREIDRERVLVLADFSGGRGKTSGLEIGQLGGSRGTLLVHIRDGKVSRLVVYWDRDRALADLGLEE